jgi:hypothetical protein
MKLPAKLAIASLAAIALAVPASAQNATTDPVGFVTTTVRASSNGVSFAVTPISPVMLAASSVNGTTLGTLSAVSSSNLTIASAAWVTNQLSASDVCVLFKTGNLTGLVVPVASNTVDTITVSTDGINLASSGANIGDQVQLIQGDNILSMFGTPVDGVVGGNATQFSAGQTDRVSVRDISGTLRTYYYNTQFNQWRRSGSQVSQDTVQISPVSGAFYSRIATSNLTITTTGAVPNSQVKIIVPASGSFYAARFFPAEGSINDFGFQNLPGWQIANQGGVTIANADKVVTTDISGVVRTYYYDATSSSWRRSGSGVSQDSVAVPPAGAVKVVRSGSGSAQILNVPLPYSL